VAYTNQTLPGNPREWHFLSSSLDASVIGFSYAHNAPFNWDPDPCGLSFSQDDDYALFPSDMPAVDKMDLFAFYEPEYHWVNFKRNSGSHWHMDNQAVHITYTNEPSLLPGKGYLVSDRVVERRLEAERIKAQHNKEEQDNAQQWSLSDREKAIIEQLNQNETNNV
jgi:hypothetical protein